MAPERASRPSDLQYAVRTDADLASRHRIEVDFTFTVPEAGVVALSFPVWTPGSYEFSHFARFVTDFTGSQAGRELDWDKADHDTWRVRAGAAGPVRVSFAIVADTLDVGMAGAWRDFAYFNGAAVFPYVEGVGLEAPARVTLEVGSGWKVAGGMTPAGPPATYEAATYHELVDMPFFMGALDVDSARVDGHWYRLATHPQGALAGEDREMLWRQLRAALPEMADVFGEVPWRDYTTLALFDERFAGGAALEHRNSNLGIYTPRAVGSSTLTSIVTHEIFHAWNVKRLRPADMWPYRYDREQPTTLLWVSEGITDYYADLVLARSGVWDAERFYRSLAANAEASIRAGRVALEDASLSTWTAPAVGDRYVYYPKGAAVGFLLDVMIREASGGRASLDDVMATLYRERYLRGSGFTEEAWWDAVEAAAGRSFASFRHAYVDGREPLPWDSVLPLVGLVMDRDVVRRPFIDLQADDDSAGVRVTEVEPGSPAEASGIRVGDRLVRLGSIDVEDLGSFVSTFWERYADAPEGTVEKIVVFRDGESITLETEIEFSLLVSVEVREDTGAPEEASSLRRGLLAPRRSERERGPLGSGGAVVDERILETGAALGKGRKTDSPGDESTCSSSSLPSC